jgi:hypothetical protein
MPLKKDARRIKSLLDQLLKVKTNKEKLYLVFRIKLVLETIEEPIRKQKDKEAAAAAKKKIVKKALRQFLTALDAIFEKHEEVGDTAVREKMTDAINFGFIKLRRRFKLPKTFGMFSNEGNKLVHAAIEKFLAHSEVVAASKLLKTPEDRMIAFQDRDVKSVKGYTFFEYFGITNSPKGFDSRWVAKWRKRQQR